MMADPLSPSLASRFARHVVLMSLALIYLLPFVWMLSISLKPASEIFDAGFNLIPREWAAWENYSAALTRVPLLRYLLNGVVVCAGISGRLLLRQDQVSRP